MTPELQALGKRAMACKGWRWAPVVPGRGYGMLTAAGNRILWDHGETPFLRGSPFDEVRADAIPDLDDAATRGCLLELAREACGDPTMHVEWTGDGAMWVVVHAIPPAGLPGNGASEIEALVAALEAAS